LNPLRVDVTHTLMVHRRSRAEFRKEFEHLICGQWSS
jgi:hypothetical protein